MKNSDPVRLYAEDDIRVPRRMVAVLREKIDGYTDTVMAGHLSIEAYNYLAGSVAGLREALQVAEDIAKELDD